MVYTNFYISCFRENHVTQQPTVLFKRTRHHKGSIYCMSWTPDGSLIATGSNDKTVKLMKFNADTSNLEGQEIELAMHDGTVRDVCFIEDTTNRSSLLISGGAGDCKIYVTDCETGQPYQALSGHSGMYERIFAVAYSTILHSRELSFPLLKYLEPLQNNNK